MSLQDLWAEARQFSEHSSIEDHSAALEISASSRTKLEDAPLPFSLDELAQLAEKQLKPATARQDLVALLVCLRHLGGRKDEFTDLDAIGRLATAITSLIAPISRGVSDDTEDPYLSIAERTRGVADVGLQALWQLLQNYAPSRIALDRQGMLTLLALTDSDGLWSTEKITSLAGQITDQLLRDSDRDSFIVEDIFKGYLRPLFSKSRPSTVTGSGRKAEYQDPDLERERAIFHDERESKPWKYKDLRAVPAFAWAINQASETLINNTWYLAIPVLLTLDDDPTTRVRSRGLALTARFLDKISSQVLRNTGLVGAFQQAIFPTLNFLPSLTPEDESIQLLGPAFSALLILSEQVSTSTGLTEATKMRDTILREGVFAAFFHAREHVRIVEVLFRHAAALIKALQIHAVKHLKHLIPMVSSVITDPFALSHPPSLLAAIAALQETIANCWPRLADGVWQDEIIRILTLGWLLVLDSSSQQGHDTVRNQLVKTAGMLSAVANNAGTPLSGKLRPLLEKEPDLTGLFGKTE